MRSKSKSDVRVMTCLTIAEFDRLMEIRRWLNKDDEYEAYATVAETLRWCIRQGLIKLEEVNAAKEA